MNIIFWATREKPLEISAWVTPDDALGWFTLERELPVGSTNFSLIARSTRAPDPDDEIAHQFPLLELEQGGWAAMKLRLKVAPLSKSGDDLRLFLQASQGGTLLRATNRAGDVLNAKNRSETSYECATTIFVAGRRQLRWPV